MRSGAIPMFVVLALGAPAAAQIEMEPPSLVTAPSNCRPPVADCRRDVVAEGLRSNGCLLGDRQNAPAAAATPDGCLPAPPGVGGDAIGGAVTIELGGPKPKPQP